MIADIQQLEGAARMAMGNFSDFDQADEPAAGMGWMMVLLGLSFSALTLSGFVALLFM